MDYMLIAVGLLIVIDFITKYPGGKSFIMKAARGPVDDFCEYLGAQHHSVSEEFYIPE